MPSRRAAAELTAMPAHCLRQIPGTEHGSVQAVDVVDMRVDDVHASIAMLLRSFEKQVPGCIHRLA